MISNERFGPWTHCTNIYTRKPEMGMNTKGHFAFPFPHPFFLIHLLPPSIICLSPPSFPLFLSVKVMQLIFLCLFIFQDWLWNVGSRQKPHRPLPFLCSIHPSPPAHFSSMLVIVRPKKIKKNLKKGKKLCVEECKPHPSCSSILVSSFPLYIPLFLSNGSLTTFH